MFSISNKHEEFFDYLIENAEKFRRGAVIANEVMKDLSLLPDHMEEITNLEHGADKVNFDVIKQLARVFITPIDREDFYNLSCRLEDCIDNLHGFIMRVICTILPNRRRQPCAVRKSSSRWEMNWPAPLNY